MYRRRHGHRDGGGGLIAVRIARAALDTIVAHAREARPAECCGLLLGVDGAIVEAVRTPNVSDDPNRFTIEPAAHIAARREARERGLAVLGFYHSHPHSPPAPSVTDLSEASYPDHLYLIVSPAPERAQIRIFRFVDSRFVETPFLTET
ncbi:MAG TPA: M67 family metallopeptidase [Vicinamibacterales bacterium]|nr:M67 family metallopeptidase [Vicinamibacterales bacterium]